MNTPIQHTPVEYIRDGIVVAGQVCEWFARCHREATHMESHPILGQVPACDRCPTIGR